MTTKTTKGLKDIELIPISEVEKISHLKISTIYAKMASKEFPIPYECGRRRLWGKQEIIKWKLENWKKPAEQDNEQDKTKEHEAV